ncbi:MAG TPA: DUF2911 domain-containing protein [Chitinophagaceae bacterium]
MKMTWLQLIMITLLFSIFSCKGKEKEVASKPVIEKDTNTAPANINVTPNAVVNPYAGVDVSPMDMSYYPVDYPKLKMANDNTPPLVARVVYSRPHLQGRHLFNDVLKYGEPWRLGANESTEIQLYRDVTIQGKKVKAGRYILYCIPEADKWTIVLNTNIDSWGLKQEPAKDIQRFDIPAIHDHNGPSLEYFTIVFEKTAGGADMVMAWGDVLAKLPINF